MGVDDWRSAGTHVYTIRGSQIVIFFPMLKMSPYVLLLTLALVCLHGQVEGNCGANGQVPIFSVSAEEILVGNSVTLSCSCPQGQQYFAFYGSGMTWSGRQAESTYTVTPGVGEKYYYCRCWCAWNQASHTSNKIYINTVAETQTQTVCERQDSISMSCPSGTTITVTHSFYGRADKTTCTTHPNGGQWGQAQLRKTNCVSSKAGGIIENACNGQAACEIEVTNDAMGNQDPCGGIYKYADVAWQCA